MLVLSRRRGESIIIGGDYEIVVRSYNRRRVIVDIISLHGSDQVRTVTLVPGKPFTIAPEVNIHASKHRKPANAMPNVDAPRSLVIDRKEVRLAKKKEVH